MVSRGNIKEVEKKLGISYPTVRGKLDGIIEKLGFSRKDEAREKAVDKRKKILEELERGKIDTSTAIEKLKEIKDQEG